MTIPTFDLGRAPPGKMRMPTVMGGGIEGGRALAGSDSVIDMTGGGIVAVSYSDIGLGNVDYRRQLYWSSLGGILNPRVRSIIVPLLTDFITPGGIKAALVNEAPMNASTITIAVQGLFVIDRLLQGGEWFEIVHPTLLNRAHVITDIDGYEVAEDGSAIFSVGIRPPLRGAAADGAISYPAGTALNFNRPKCLMRLAPGSQIISDVEAGWWTTPSVDFVESWGSI